MASSSTSLPDSFSLEVSVRGSLRQSPDRPTSSPFSSLVDYFVGQEWRDDAACLDIPSDFFFPDRGVPGDEIRDVCFPCPVRLDCLEDSVRTMPKFGWAGGHPKEGRTEVRKLMADGYTLELADAIVLSDSLSRVRQRKKVEQGRRFDLDVGDVVLGEHVLAS